MIRYSIIMPFIDRAPQLWNSLVSFDHWYSERHDWEVVIVPDVKCSDRAMANLGEIVRHWSQSGMRIRALSPFGSADEACPVRLFNAGHAAARGDIVILTSPEIFHAENVLAGLDQQFDREQDIYAICGCQELKQKRISRISRYRELLPGSVRGRWYQHSQVRPADYHWCTALTRDNYKKIGGFNEDLSTGYCFDDDDWREKVRAAGLRFVRRDDLLTYHQEHKPAPKPAGHMERWQRNKAIYEKRWGAYQHIEPGRGDE